MSVSPTWTFVLAKSNNLERIGHLRQASQRSVQLVHNRAGAVSFKFPLTDDLADEIQPITSAIMAYRRGSDNINRLVWSGYVWTVNDDISGDSLTVNALGWLQKLDKRLLRRPKNYTGNKPGESRPWRDHEIIQDLLAEANLTTTPADGLDLAYGVEVIDGATPFTPTLMEWGTSVGDFSTHGRDYPVAKHSSILSEIIKLTDIENGCDIWVDPETRQLNVYERIGLDKPDVQFAYGTGAYNIQNISRSIDPSSTVNWFAAIGPSTMAPVFADTKFFPDPASTSPTYGENSQKSYGLIEEVVSISEIADNPALATYAAGEIVARSVPQTVYEFTPFPYTKDQGQGRIPEPILDYNIGDIGRLSAKRGKRINIVKSPHRIYGITISLDDQGNEIISSLQTAATTLVPS